MPNHHCLEEFLSHTLMKNRLYRLFFVYYTGFFDLKNLFIKKEIKLWIRKNQPSSLRVLDVGFGFGQQIQYLLDIYPKAHVLGIDVSEHAVASANKYFGFPKFSNVYCKTKDITEFYGGGNFQLVFAFKLLNYVQDDDVAIQKMYDALQEGGSLFVMNTYSAKHQVPVTYDKVYKLPLQRPGYTMEELRDKLKAAGFKTIKCRYLYGATGRLAWKIGINIPVTLLNTSYFLLPIVVLYAIIASPIVFLLNFYDMAIGHTSGQSLFLRAEK
jgi:SAM-dependent methyltransferase